MKKFKFIAFIFAIMTTTLILQSCLDDNDGPADLLVISTINKISQDSKDFYFTASHSFRTISSEYFIMHMSASYAPICGSFSSPSRFFAISSGNLTLQCHASG